MIKEKCLYLSINLKREIMTKAKMIEKMQQMEAAAWLTLTHAEWDGEESAWYKTCRAKWAALHNAMTSMGIESDYTLPDQVTAFELQLKLAV
jgi:hypothetical protein